MKELFLTILQSLKFWQWFKKRKDVNEAVDVEREYDSARDNLDKLLPEDEG